MDTVKISWSGGKDSTMSVVQHLRDGDHCKVVCYIPMLDDSIPLIRRDHYEFIRKMEVVFSRDGADVFIIHGCSFDSFVRKITTRGPNKGKPFGAAVNVQMRPGFCGFKRDSKVKALSSFALTYDYEDIGIAFDEVLRQKQLTDKKRSILIERRITEAQALDECKRLGFLSPIYNDQERDGCAICPFAKKGELQRWINSWGDEARAKLLEIESFCRENRPDRVPLRDYKWWSDVL